MNIKNCFLNLCSFPHQVWNFTFVATYKGALGIILHLFFNLKFLWNYQFNFFEIMLKAAPSEWLSQIPALPLFPNYFWFPFSLLSQWYFLLIMVGYFKERNFRGKKLRGFRVFCQKFIPTNYFKIVQSGKFIPRNGFTISILPKFTYFTEFYN